jgi:hypothetical protein
MEMSQTMGIREIDSGGMEGRAYYREREGMDSQEEGSGFNGNWALKYVEEIALPQYFNGFLSRMKNHCYA